MALVSYSDSEASDSENENVNPPSDKKVTSGPAPSNPPKPTTTAPSANFQSIVDRGNPRKIRVALPEIKPEPSADGDQDGEDGPARKKPKIGGGGGAFSGFSAFLPAPKRNNVTADKANKPSVPARKAFGLKTGATPGFDREADAEMLRDQEFGFGEENGNETIPKPGSLRADPSKAESATAEKKEEEVKLKGNPMMFRPLSVGRNSQQKKKPLLKTSTPALSAAGKSTGSSLPRKEQPVAQTAPLPPVQKPKISLFSLSNDESHSPSLTEPPVQGTAYEPLVYNSHIEAAPAGPQPEPQTLSTPAQTDGSSQQQTLGNIADDLNLSRAERRHLFGRHADPSQSRVLHFNTDTEYASNQAMAHETDLAAAQHNPVRSIAPGKHTLQQLVNAASTQREALEESFATGKRNKKEAGSKYGW